VGNAQQVYDESDPQRRKTLAAIWPDLATALEQVRAAALSDRKMICALTHDAPGLVEAVGRKWLNGTPVCAKHLEGCDRPGGYPLEFVDKRTWKP
jgi:hypothetical protein